MLGRNAVLFSHAPTVMMIIAGVGVAIVPPAAPRWWVGAGRPPDGWRALAPELAGKIPQAVERAVTTLYSHVTIDIAALCLKSGNATILRGGKKRAQKVERRRCPKCERTSTRSVTVMYSV